MIRTIVVAWLALVVAVAHADDDGAAFRAATQRAIAGDARAIDDLEALGAARPLSRWSDDAWSEAARLAERAGELGRARRAHEQVLAIGRDAALVERSRAALARLSAETGAGQWDAVAREHTRLVEAANAGGDPHGALEALETLVRAHPQYPRATLLRLAIARVWEREGETTRALAWFRAAREQARGIEELRAGLAHARALIRAGALAAAEAELGRLEGRDPAAVAQVRDELARAARRTTRRHALAAILVGVVGIMLVLARRHVGSWCAFARPPLEVRYLLPITGVLVVIAQTGNPLVARAVTTIAIAGIAIAWVAGVGGAHARTRRALASHAALAVVAVALVAYLAIDRYRLIDLLRETAEHGFSR